jgi:hypothetical protein
MSEARERLVEAMQKAAHHDMRGTIRDDVVMKMIAALIAADAETLAGAGLVRIEDAVLAVREACPMMPSDEEYDVFVRIENALRALAPAEEGRGA